MDEKIIPGCTCANKQSTNYDYRKPDKFINLDKKRFSDRYLHYLCTPFNDSVVQLDRMTDSGSVGWRFDSSRGH